MPVETNIVPTRGARIDISTVDAAIGALAEDQHGQVARRQLLSMAIGRRSIQHRLACGRLRPTDHPGVYSVGHRPQTRESRWMGAALAMGNGAVLSHRSAGVIWGVRSAYGGSIEVTAPNQRRPSGPIRVVRAALPADELTVRNHLPITTSVRTLFDLAVVLDAQALKRAIEEGEVLRLSHALSLHDLLDRHPGHRGNAKLRAILEDRSLGATVTRRELEQRFLSLIERSGLPRAQCNALIESYEVDACWPEQRLIVELDGRSTHLTIAAFERDRIRDRRLTLAGWRVIRITWRQLHDDPGGVVADLNGLTSRPLGARS